jgi:hypothetical protein
MNRIKIIKKNGFIEQNQLSEKAGEIFRPVLNPDETAGIVKDWIINWREQKEIKTQRALADLKQFKFRDLV